MAAAPGAGGNFRTPRVVTSFDPQVFPQNELFSMNLLSAALLVLATGALQPGYGQGLATGAAAPDEPRPLVFDCSWFPHPPRAERVLVDLVLAREADDRNLRPTPDELAAVRAAEGMVQHIFQVPMIRAELDTSAVRALILGAGAVGTFARIAPDPRVQEVEVQIRFDRPVTESDVAALGRLDARDLGHVPRPDVLEVALADSEVPAVRRLAGVHGVEPMTVGCAAEVGPPSVLLSELPPPPVGREWGPAVSGPRLETDFPSYGPGAEVTVTLFNPTADRIGYNLCHAELELLREGVWVRVLPMLWPVCTDILLRLEPGKADSLAFRLEPDLPAGQYRVRHRLLNGEPMQVVSNVFAVTPRGPPRPAAGGIGAP
jgi:hypothetical protein